MGVQGPHALLAPVQVGLRNAAERLATPRCRTVSLTWPLSVRVRTRRYDRRTARAVGTARPTPTRTDLTDGGSTCRVVVARGTPPPSWRSRSPWCSRWVRLVGPVEAADSRGQVHAAQARVLLRADPEGHERVEQRRRAGPLRQAAHRRDLRDRHPPGINRQGLQLEGARQVGVRQVREVLREVPGRRREPRYADPAELGVVPALRAWLGRRRALGDRCDLVGGPAEAKQYAPLPASAKGLFRAKPPEQWLTCAQGRGRRSRRRCPAVDSTTGGQSPRSSSVPRRTATPRPAGPGAVARTSARIGGCVDAATVDYEFGYTCFDEAEWKAGQRRTVCWGETDR